MPEERAAEKVGLGLLWMEVGLQSDFSDGNRLAGEYSDYTWDHLPELPKNVEAMFANFAARMAFSSFWIL